MFWDSIVTPNLDKIENMSTISSLELPELEAAFIPQNISNG